MSEKKTYRTLQEAFGPYAKLHVPKERKPWRYIIAAAVIAGAVAVALCHKDETVDSPPPQCGRQFICG